MLAVFLWSTFSRDPSLLVVWRKTQIVLKVGPLPPSLPSHIPRGAERDMQALVWQGLISPSLLPAAKGTEILGSGNGEMAPWRASFWILSVEEAVVM